jgi:hypothetical protein
MSDFSILPWRLGELQWFPSSLLVPPHVASQFLTLEKKHTRSIQCVCPNLGLYGFTTNFLLMFMVKRRF